MGRAIIGFGAALLIGGGGFALAAAQGRDFPVLQGDLTETFTGEVKTGGSIVVGFWLGDPDSNVATEALLVRVPYQIGTVRACYSGASRDGSYFGRSVLSGVADRETYYKIGPMSRSAYAAQIGMMPPQDFAFRVVSGDGCDAGLKDALLPAATKPDATQLFVAVNTMRALKTDAWLSLGDKREVATCTYDKGKRSVAFDTICVFDKPPLGTPGEWVLSIKRVTRAGPPRVDDFKVRL